ncbi:MAG: CoA transferase, partial [Anaerolineae bacterium]|nr:CoA transferase [Anaerolineae bacterium]
IIDRWIDRADVIIENYAPGTMARLGLGYEQVVERNPRIVYCSLKGFMEGPYEQRTALDEPVQMMSGLAYMTGPPGQPLRAGTSIMDILGATYGALGILAALRERDQTGKGQFVQTGLFEAAAYAMGQHLAHAALRDDPLQPYPGQVRAWAIYQLFDTSDHRQVFIGVTSDHHWARFCEVFNRPDLYGDSSLTTNNQRCAAHDWLIPELKRMFKTLTFEEITDRCETGGFPYAPVNHPEDLWNNPHLNAGTWLDTTFPNPHADITAKLPRQPLLINHQGHTIRQNPPNVGEHTAELLAEVGFDEKTIQELSAKQIIVI